MERTSIDEAGLSHRQCHMSNRLLLLHDAVYFGNSKIATYEALCHANIQDRQLCLFLYV